MIIINAALNVNQDNNKYNHFNNFKKRKFQNENRFIFNKKIHKNKKFQNYPYFNPVNKEKNNLIEDQNNTINSQEKIIYELQSQNLDLRNVIKNLEENLQNCQKSLETAIRQKVQKNKLLQTAIKQKIKIKNELKLWKKDIQQKNEHNLNEKSQLRLNNSSKRSNNQQSESHYNPLYVENFFKKNK